MSSEDKQKQSDLLRLEIMISLLAENIENERRKKQDKDKASQ
jgi:hypothetical protein